MSRIVPTVTTDDPHLYRQQVERVCAFAPRIHIDLADGVFALNRLIEPIQVWWPEGITADIHLMYQDPVAQAETIISLAPDLVIIPAEADGDLAGLIDHWHKFGLKVGVALLQDTTVGAAAALIGRADHVLIFSGSLGRFGGVADLRLLGKVAQAKALNPAIELGWDGGISLDNVAELAAGGIDVLNVGGAIQRAADPAAAFEALSKAT